MMEKKSWVRVFVAGLFSVGTLLLVNACGVDDGLGKAGQTEEEFFTVIEAPIDLQVVSAGGSSLSLVWADMSTDEEGFAIFRREDAAADFIPAAVVVADTTTYDDTGLTPGQTYHYYIRALRGPFISSATDVATGTTLLTPPAAPASLTTLVLSNASIVVSWPDVDDEISYSVEYSDVINSPTVWTPSVVPADYSTTVISSLTPSTEYAFRIKATNDVGDSSYTFNSPPNPVTDADPPPIPAPPTGLTAQTQYLQDIRLDWLDNSSVEEEYIIKLGGVEIDRVVADQTFYIDYNLVAGSYNYSVSAVNSSGESAPDTAGVVMPAAPAAPTNLGIVYQLTSYRLNWTDNATNEEYFKIWAYPVSCLDVTRLIRPTLVADLVPQNTTSYTLYSTKNPPPSSAVCVYVQAFNDGGIGTSAKLSYTVK